jgi:23S rRNA G2445 N2-methylase RlmL
MTVGGAIQRNSAFAFERWRAHHVKDYREYKKTLKTSDFAKANEVSFVGSDIDGKAIKASLHNVAVMGKYQNNLCNFLEGYEAVKPNFIVNDFELVAPSIR